jgi:hypothetical protein
VPFHPNGGQQTTSSMKGLIAVDGAEGMSVTCTVRETNGAFQVSASLRSPAADRVTGAPLTPTIVTLMTTIAAGQTASGTVTLQDYQTTTAYSSVNEMGLPGATCEFSVAPLQANDQLGVAPGRLWASVECPRFRDPQSSNANEVCSIGAGNLVLENCLP